MLTDGLDTEEIIVLAATRIEIPWGWGVCLPKEETDAFAQECGMKLEWWKPIRPGDMYLAKRNTGYKLLECRVLGEACVYPIE